MTLPLGPSIPLVPPPLRLQPNAPDLHDGSRVAYAWRHWDAQTGALLMRDRQVEEAVYMLVGKQDIAWSRSQQRWVDVSEAFRDQQELRWRHRPRLNRIAGWYAQTMSRLTENPPILTFLPGPDAIDAELAETMDTLFKAQWRELGMQHVHEQMMAWMTVGGRGYIVSQLDAVGGDAEAWRGRAEIPVVDPTTREPLPHPETGGPWLVPWEDVGFDATGAPVTVLVPGPEGLEPLDVAEPHSAPTGRMVPQALSPLQVRGEWGPNAWHEKTWHAVRSFLTPAQVWERWGVQVQGSTTLASDGLSGNGALERMLFGAGFYGAASHLAGSEAGGGAQPTSDSFVEVLTLWERPNDQPGYAPVDGSAGGRLLVCTRHEVLWDGQRPLPYKYTSPIRCFDFLKLPGRPTGSSPIEWLCPIQRAYNRTWGSITEHAAKMTNPFWVVNAGSGLDAAQITNEVGQKFTVNRQTGQPAIELVAPPALGSDVYKTLGLLLEEFNAIGELQGTSMGSIPKDASGELIKELRYNSDRFLGPTLRASVEEYGRMAEDWMVMFPVLWPVEKIVRYAGDDYVARTLSVLPLMFEKGTVNVQPDVESMLPEGRGDREKKALDLYQQGLLSGPPGSPEAVRAYLEIARFPNFNRLHRPGGVHRITAEHLLGRLLEGDASVVQPQPTGQPQLWFPWYNAQIHLMVFGEFMAKPEYLKLDPQLQQMLGMRWAFLQQLVQQEQMAQMQQQAALAAPSPTGGEPAPSGVPQ